MKITGIVAEYNPFHNGHAYQIKKAREVTGCDYCIAVISGDFVQRGEPAVYSKYLRTRMALACGADLVVLAGFLSILGEAVIARYRNQRTLQPVQLPFLISWEW